MKLSELRKMMAVWPQGRNPAEDDRRNEYLRSIGLDPGSIYQELEMDSRFVDTHRDQSRAENHVNLHSHDFYEILFCRNDCGAEYLVGTERYRLKKGDVVMMPPGISHRPLLPERMQEPYIRDVLWLSQEFVAGLQRDFPQLLGGAESYITLLRTGEEERETIGALFERGVRESGRESEERELAVIANTLTLLVQLRRACARREARPMQAEKPELLDMVLSYVEQHLAEKITLQMVAKHFYVSASTVTQTFRNRMNVSFYRCVTQRRLIAAKSLIEEGVPLETVAGRVGFTDYSSFYRAFKQEYGISPRQYRNLRGT